MNEAIAIKEFRKNGPNIELSSKLGKKCITPHTYTCKICINFNDGTALLLFMTNMNSRLYNRLCIRKV